MAADKSDATGSFLANPNALLALVTIAGGLWLVSNKLTSDRPVIPAGGAKGFVADQNVEARLWEDPFKKVDADDSGVPPKLSKAIGTIDTLVEQVAWRAGRGTGESSNPAALRATDGVVLLPVMLSGGQYSEDREARIRSRFAIISALGRSGYAPDDAEHIGVATIPWPTQRQLAVAMKVEPGRTKLTRLWGEPGSAEKGKFFASEFKEGLSTMDVRYEWYRRRDFAAGSAHKSGPSAVLVLWLNDAYFEDEPVLRLPLLLEPLTDPSLVPAGASPLRVKLIGPRRSSTLRAMLPDWKTGIGRLAALRNKDIDRFARQVLRRIDVYSATASAMDEVLVKDAGNSDETPRAAVATLLQQQGFASFHNFTATDAQLAEEVLEELALRGADLTKEENHVVLISEWDTFYGRTLSLTYAAQLAKKQTGRRGEAKDARSDRAEFVRTVTHSSPTADFGPKNFHSFAYLRGLDGQSVGPQSTRDSADEPERKAAARPSTIEDFHHWSPDLNKAEGQAQFDYLGRLGDQLDGLQRRLRRQGRDRIKAIGIVGSDVYDTLLILQALRQRFANVLFFTTDLDVRFFHPHEREWARNLIVVSSYGLQLHESLQDTVAPFRDSTQTAQFAATLAALGNRRLDGLPRIPPRRFEVGNGTTVDLSVSSSRPPSIAGQPDDVGVGVTQTVNLHPQTTSEHSHSVTDRMIWGVIAGFLALLGASLMWDPFRRLTWEGWSYPGKALKFSEEDIGGPDGAEALLRWLPTQDGNDVAKYLLRDRRLVRLQERHEAEAPGELGGPNWSREDAFADAARCLVARLNRCLAQDAGRDEYVQQITEHACGGMARARPIWAFWRPTRSMVVRQGVRRYLDEFLSRVQPAERPGLEEVVIVDTANAHDTASLSHDTPISTLTRSRTNSWSESRQPMEVLAAEADDTREATALRAASAARQSAGDLYRLRCRRLACFWLSFAMFGAAAGGLAVAIWWDAFHRSTGEPFSLSNGTSAWPAQIVRLIVILLVVCFTVGLSHTMRETFHAVTRAFRFAPPATTKSVPADHDSAEAVWHVYREGSSFRKRWWRIVGGLALYFLALIAIFSAQGEEVLNPVRGDLITPLNRVLIVVSVIGFLLLAFLTIDASCRCRRFIERISVHPTEYPEATRRHFSRQMGRIDMKYLDEWIDLQLIAELTEKVGRLVYYPAGLILLLLLARNSWWDAWTWPESLVAVFALNFTLALAAVVILQRAARDAKRKSEESLTTKVKKLQAETMPSEAVNNATQAEKLLEEMRQLRRGAFVPFWENPVVGAVFLSSGGTTMLQVFIWFMGR
jgi:uncharacterized integral membrane protein